MTGSLSVLENHTHIITRDERGKRYGSTPIEYSTFG